MAKTYQHTLAHVTHEAVEQIGGIGTVLRGLMASPVYQQHVRRSILIGPTATHIAVDPHKRLGEHGKVLYSSIDQIDEAGLAGRFRPVEWAFNVAIVYGKRTFTADGQQGEAEVLLIDVFKTNPDRLNIFKLRLWETFGLDSSRYEKIWDYEEYTRLAEPAFYALEALLRDQDKPCTIFSHEFMGMPTALQAILDGRNQFHTVFHAHECATARWIVENAPGHDTMFYNVLKKAQQQHLYVQDVFGPVDQLLRHALISRSHLCDGIIAVGDKTAQEMKFLGPKFEHHPIDLIYNGVPALEVTMTYRKRCRKMMSDYTVKLLGFKPDLIMTHVTRPVISKGLWRDLTVCDELDQQLTAKNQTGVLYILTSGGGVRRPQDVAHMEQAYGWPRHHQPGYPDLVGPEEDICRDVEAFNKGHNAVRIVLVNQFGWSHQRVGSLLPKDMNFTDLRCGTDVEFGMATYEPFGISPLEPLAAGALCVISSVCGCKGFVDHVTQGSPTPNVIEADFTQLQDDSQSIEELKQMTRDQRDRIERIIARDIAAQILKRHPTTDVQRQKMLDQGQTLVAKMGWDQVVGESLIPMLDRIVTQGKVRQSSRGAAKKD
jgi:hypothetical protein